MDWTDLDQTNPVLTGLCGPALSFILVLDLITTLCWFLAVGAMNTSDSEEDLYNERTALVPSENPALPCYRPDPHMTPPEDSRDSKRLKVRFDIMLTFMMTM